MNADNLPVCTPSFEFLEQRLLLATYYVDAALGNNSNTGDATHPWATIKYAVTTVGSGSTIEVRSGTYRENSISFPRSGTSQSSPTILKAAAGANVIVKGSAVVTGWSAVAGTTATYRHTGWNYYFGAWDAEFLTNPNSSKDARSRARNQLFVDGQIYKEVAAASQMTPGTFYINNSSNYIDLWLADGSTPTDNVVEASNTENALLTTNGKNYIKIQGLQFEHCANPPQGTAAVRVTGGNYVTVENISVQWAAGAGFYLEGTHQTVRNSVFNHNGQLGINSTGADYSLVEDCENSWNNTHPNKKYSPGWEGGGNKFTRSNYLTVNRMLSHDNQGSGIWFDIDNHNGVISNSISYLNLLGIHYEISYTGTIFNNLVYSNSHQDDQPSSPVGIGIYISSSAMCEVYNNTVWDNDGYGISIAGTVRGDGNDHDVAGTNNIIYNNIVVDNAKASQYTRQFNISYGKNPTASLPTLTNPIYTPAFNVSDYNLFYDPTPGTWFFDGPSGTLTTLSAWQSGSLQDAHSVWGDPGFTNSGSADFTLLASSPAIDVGKTLTDVLKDYVGTNRPQGAAYDMGAYEKTAALTGPRGYWKLNENSGTAIADSSGNNYAGTRVGGSWTGGLIGNALSLAGGTGSYATLPSAVLDGARDLSVAFWVKTSATSQQSIVSGANASRDNEFEVLLNGPTQLRLYYHGRSVAWAMPSVADGAWHHYAVVCNDIANTIEAYLDGVSLGAIARPVDLLTIDAGGLVLGQEQDSIGGGFDALQSAQSLLDDVAIYTRPLSPAEVAALANASDPLAQGLIGYYKLDETSGTTVADSSGASHPAANLNASIVVGKSGNGLSFDGTVSDYLNLPSTMLSAATNLTFSCWIKTANTGTQTLLSGASSANTNLLMMRFLSSTSFDVFYNGATLSWTGLTSIADNQWHNVAVVISQATNTTELFIDGVSKTAKATTVASITPAANGLVIGQDQDSVGGGFEASQAFLGVMDEVRLYGRALSSVDVLQLASLA